MKALGPKAFSIGLTLVATLVTLVALSFLQNSEDPQRIKKTSSVAFQTKKSKRVSQIKKRPRPKPKKRKAKADALKPQVHLSMPAGGLDLGVDILGLASKNSGLLSGKETAMTGDVVDQLPQIQYREPIPYPERAKEKGVNGQVTVNVLVNKKGGVDSVKLIDTFPPGLFEQAALQGVREWVFTPAEYQGKLVSVWVKQKLKFQVN